jgi:hypothetical protein
MDARVPSFKRRLPLDFIVFRSISPQARRNPGTLRKLTGAPNENAASNAALRLDGGGAPRAHPTFSARSE